MPWQRPRARRVAARVIRAGAVLVLGGIAVGGGPAAAGATPDALPLHARLESSAPADGSRVEAVGEVVLAFSEEVNPSFVAVTVEGPVGTETEGGPAVDGREVTQTLVSGLPAGEHVVTFRVVSADGHPVSGTVTFTTTLGAPSAQPSPSATGAGSPQVSGQDSPAPTADATTASWPAVALGAVLFAGLVAGVLWRSRRGSSDGEQPGGRASP